MVTPKKVILRNIQLFWQDFKLLDLEAKKEAPETPEKHNKVELQFFVIVVSIDACWTRSLEMDPLWFNMIKSPR